MNSLHATFLSLRPSVDKRYVNFQGTSFYHSSFEHSLHTVRWAQTSKSTSYLFAESIFDRLQKMILSRLTSSVNWFGDLWMKLKSNFLGKYFFTFLSIFRSSSMNTHICKRETRRCNSEKKDLIVRRNVCTFWDLCERKNEITFHRSCVKEREVLLLSDIRQWIGLKRVLGGTFIFESRHCDLLTFPAHVQNLFDVYGEEEARIWFG